MVSMSASIWVGCQVSVSPFHTGTPANLPRISTDSWVNPRYSMPSYMRPSTRGVLDRLAGAQVGLVRPEVGDVPPLVVRAGLERRPGAGRGLLEDQRDVPAREPVFPLAAAFLG